MKDGIRAVSVALVLSSVAAAAGPVRVVVVRDDPYGIMANRVGAEASAAGLDVIETAGGADDGELARRYDARAVVRSTARGGISIYVLGPGDDSIRDVVERLPDEDAVSALRAVERLRARFVEVGLA